MPWNPPFPAGPDPRRALAIARHEFGHYVVARALGFQTGEISLTLNFPDGHRGEASVTLSRPVSPAEISDYLEKRVQILYAGALAEALVKQTVDQDLALTLIADRGAQQDHAKARELIQLLRNCRFPTTTDYEQAEAELAAIDLELWNKAAELVEFHAEDIHGLAGRLISEIKAYDQKVTLSATELDMLPALLDRFGPTFSYVR